MPTSILVGEPLPVKPVKGLVVKPYLLTSEMFWGLITLGKWESRLQVKLYTSAQSINWYISHAHGHEWPTALT